MIVDKPISAARPSDPANVARRSWSIFSIPKPFVGGAAISQRNAVGSWLRLIPGDQILLLGNAVGTVDAAQEFGSKHIGDLSLNEQGTPELSGAFSGATSFFDSELLVYANADVMFDENMGRAFDQLIEQVRDPFLGIGRRINVEIERRVDLSLPSDIDWFRQQVSAGECDTVMCKDFFVFPRGWFSNLPPFAVGRGNWDNWMVYAAKKMKLRVIDLSPVALAIHPVHKHEHVAGGQRAAYVDGPEARNNQKLAGGRNWIRGSTADWILTPSGLRRQRLAKIHLPFWRDLPQIMRLGWKLFRT